MANVSQSVISQNDIDRMMAAIKTNSGQKVFKYDPSMPRFTTRNSVVSVVDSHLAQLHNSFFINPDISDNFVRLSNVEQMTFDELLRSVPSPALTAMFESDTCEDVYVHCAYDISKKLIGSYLDADLSVIAIHTTFSPLELAIAGIFVNKMKAFIENSFHAQYTSTPVRFENAYLYQDVRRPIDVKKKGTLIALQTSVDGSDDLFLLWTLHSFDTVKPKPPVVLNNIATDAFDVNVHAHLDNITMQLHDLKRLKHGSMLTFSTNACILAGDTPIFHATLMKPTTNYAVRLTTAIKEAPKMSKNADIVKSINDIDITIAVELGRKQMKLGDVKTLKEGDVIALNSKAGENVLIFANNALIGKGEVCVQSDEMMSVKIEEILNDDSLLED